VGICVGEGLQEIRVPDHMSTLDTITNLGNREDAERMYDRVGKEKLMSSSQPPCNPGIEVGIYDCFYTTISTCTSYPHDGMYIHMQ
jgi:hypothetical protein